MSATWAVYRREALQRVRSKWFLIGTIAAPFIMAAIFAIPIAMETRSQGQERVFALIDRTGIIAEHLTPRLEEAGYDVTGYAAEPAVVDSLISAVGEGDLGAVVIVDEETLTSGAATIHAGSTPSALRSLLIRTAVTQSAVAASLEGVDADALLAGGTLDIELLDEETEGRDVSALIAGAAGSMVIYMAVILWAVAVLRATLEEKRDRIAEIMVSAMRPSQLMLGKILGVGSVGLLQMAIWASVIALSVTFLFPALAGTRPEWTQLSEVADVLPGPGALALFLGYFLGGFFMFAGLYAAIGAMCNSDEEVQQVQLPVMLIYITPAMMLGPVISDPNGTLATTLSLIPVFSPVLMWPRVSMGAAPAWQIVTSYVLMALSVVAIAWLAGKIYKVGILMTGKRPTLPELWRWMREA